MTQKTQPVLRFAPSPNGRLHLGHAFSALFTNKVAEKLGGQTLLRIEDIDQTRCTPELMDLMLEDLEWIGFKFFNTPRKQSDHFDLYQKGAEKLKEMGLLYPCFCSRKDIQNNSTGATDPDGALLYPGTCRDLSNEEIVARMKQDAPHSWRLDMAKAVAKVGPLVWPELSQDLNHIAPVEAEPMAWGDVILVRKDTPTSYHLSVVLDDAAQNVTHVTRGKDLYFNTAIHRVLQTLFNVPTPIYLHHDLILDDAAEKLSKSNEAQSLADLRQQGWSAAHVRVAIGFA